MRLIKINSFYSSYLNYFYRKHDVSESSYHDQLAAFFHDEVSWLGAWARALAQQGIEAYELISNAEPLLRKWASENGLKTENCNEICAEQVKALRPDIIWFDSTDFDLLQRIQAKVPTIRLAIGWVGSAIIRSDMWRSLDVVLTCAPESVKKLRDAGCRAEHLHHGFDAAVLGKIGQIDKRIDLLFIGQIIPGNDFHIKRQAILLKLANKVNTEIFSSCIEDKTESTFYVMMKMLGYDSLCLLRKLGVRQSMDFLPILRKINSWQMRPYFPVNKKLKRHIKPSVYGLDMMRTIMESRVGLNIHADSSPLFASNMRLFEITGAGTCMVVDHKNNLKELFEPDKEAITQEKVYLVFIGLSILGR